MTVPVTVSAAGSHTLTVTGEVSGTPGFRVSVDGGTAATVSLAGTSFTVPVSASVTVTVPAGRDTVTFGNSTAYAPDLDAITVS